MLQYIFFTSRLLIVGNGINEIFYEQRACDRAGELNSIFLRSMFGHVDTFLFVFNYVI